MQISNFAKLKLLALMLFACTYSSQLEAAEIYLREDVSKPTVIIEGDFEPGDYQNFLELVKSQNARVEAVQIFSRGGNLGEAIAIGRLLRKLSLSSKVPFGLVQNPPRCDPPLTQPKNAENCVCASACFFAHVGSVDRFGTHIGIHRPSFHQEHYSNLSAAAAREQHQKLMLDARDYLREMNVPEAVIEKVFSVSPDNIEYIGVNDILGHFIGRVPFLEDWVYSKCDSVMPQEARWAFDDLMKRHQEGEKLSFVEKQWLEGNLVRDANYGICESDALKSARWEGFEAVFDINPAEMPNNVSLTDWTIASEIIGQSFGDLSQNGFVKVDNEHVQMIRPGKPRVSGYASEGSNNFIINRSFVRMDGVSDKDADKIFSGLTERFAERPPINQSLVSDDLSYSWYHDGAEHKLFINGTENNRTVFFAIEK